MGAFDKVRTINAVRVSHIYFNPGVRTELPLSLSPPPPPSSPSPAMKQSNTIPMHLILPDKLHPLHLNILDETFSSGRWSLPASRAQIVVGSRTKRNETMAGRNTAYQIPDGNTLSSAREQRF